MKNSNRQVLIILKSPLNYTGGKYKLLNQILPYFPVNIDKFIDLFCGGLNVGVNVEANTIIANDVNKEVLEVLYNFYKNDSDSILKTIDNYITQYNLSNTRINGYEYYNTNSSDGVATHNKKSYLKLRDDYNKGNKDSILFYTMLIFAFNNQIRFNSKCQFNMPVNKRDFNNNLRNNLIKFIEGIKSKNIKFTNNDFRELKVNKLNENDFVYLDPPYLITLASYNEQGGWTSKDDLDLYELCDKLDSFNIKFALSNVTHHKGKVNESLINWSNKYNIINLNKSYSNSNYQTNKNENKESIEVLIKNY